MLAAFLGRGLSFSSSSTRCHPCQVWLIVAWLLLVLLLVHSSLLHLISIPFDSTYRTAPLLFDVTDALACWSLSLCARPLCTVFAPHFLFGKKFMTDTVFHTCTSCHLTSLCTPWYMECLLRCLVEYTCYARRILDQVWSLVPWSCSSLCFYLRLVLLTPVHSLLLMMHLIVVPFAFMHSTVPLVEV